MMGVAGGILDLVGNTPMVRLRRIVDESAARVLAKLENLGPGGSVKDRVAVAMVEEAEEQGTLRAGSTIVGATSGNSGVSLAMVAAAKGYKLVIFMPENAPGDRRRLLLRYGADVRMTDAHLSMEGAIQGAEALAASDTNCFSLNMFTSQAVVRVHRQTTAEEILLATQGQVDAFVAGVGTGGTLTGVGERLKEVIPSVLVVAVEPAESPVLGGGPPAAHGIPGIGADFLPPLLNREIIDEIVAVADEDAIQMSLRLTREEGLLVGISSGANVIASREVAGRLGPGKTVVTVLADTGERYLSYPG